MNRYTKSPIYYMGNKYILLEQLIPLFPNKCDIFLDCFGGSGVVSMNYKGTERTIYNEFNNHIVDLIKLFKDNDSEDLNKRFEKKIAEYRLEEKEDNKYYALRDHYNKKKDIEEFYLLTCYSVNNLIRFNTNNEFNASIGWRKYHPERVKGSSDVLRDVEISNKSFFDLNLSMLTKESFVYLDPPYLNTKAFYNENSKLGEWDIDSDYKLLGILEELERKGIRWGLSNVFVNRGIENKHLK